MQAGLGPSRVSTAELAEPPGVADIHQQDVALAHRDPLLGFCRLEILAEHVLSGSSQRLPRTAGMSRSTPRPARPSLSTSIASTAAPPRP